MRNKGTRSVVLSLRADAALVDLPDPPNRFLAHEDSIGLADRSAADARCGVQRTYGMS